MRTFVFALVLGSLGLVTRVDAQLGCDPPRLLFAFDRSSSMNGTLSDGTTKWDAARHALIDVVDALEGHAELALQLFPFPDRCEPGAIVREMGAWSASDVAADLADPPPAGGLYTPMAETLAVLETYAPLLAPEHPAHVVLLTDGWQWCEPHDASRRFAPVEAVARLHALGMQVHVVGFGEGVDARTLHRAALVGGAPRSGCDTSTLDPVEAGACHHRAGDAATLRAVLDAVSRQVIEETCNGFDDDCDGFVDEDFDRDGDGHTTCGSVPGGVDATLVDCDDDDPARGPSATERCNGRDDDCDGLVDPGCGCVEGDSRRCGEEVGTCVAGVQRCVGGTWTVCEGEGRPSEVDVCDGLDEDCDGRVDEAASCGEDAICADGSCVPFPTTEPEPEPENLDPPAKMVGGCACGVSGRPPVGFAAIALLAWLRRRRG
ncbi:MAG: MopE-related protein [Polyangiales bacterium]